MATYAASKWAVIGWSDSVRLELKQAGFDDVRMYFGSWNEWSRDPALPIETAPPVLSPAAPLAMAA